MFGCWLEFRRPPPLLMFTMIYAVLLIDFQCRGATGNDFGEVGNPLVDDIEKGEFHFRASSDDDESTDLDEKLNEIKQLESHVSASLKRLDEKLGFMESSNVSSRTNLLVSPAENLHNMRADLAALARNINETMGELRSSQIEMNEVEGELQSLHEQAEEVEERDRIMQHLKEDGVDYETGHMSIANLGWNLFNNITAGGLRSSEAEELAYIRELEAKSDPAIYHVDVRLLIDIALLLAAASVGGMLATMARLPPTVGYLLGGTVVGPTGLQLVKHFVQVQTVAQFGTVFLLFTHGCGYPLKASELQVWHLRHGLGCVLLMTVLFLLVLSLPSLSLVSDRTEGWLVACCLSISSTTVVLEGLRQTGRRLRHGAYGKFIISIVAVQDLSMAVLLSLPSAMRYRSIGLAFASLAFLQTFLLYALGLIVSHMLSTFVAAPLLSHLLRVGDGEMFLLGVVTVCLSMALAAEVVTLSLEVGALVAGFMLSSLPFSEQVERAVDPLASVFGAMYFAAVGMIISPWFVLAHFQPIIGWVLLVIVVKLVVATFIAVFFSELSRSQSIQAAVSLAQIGEFSLLFISKAERLGLVSRHLYLHLLTCTVILLTLAPALNRVAASYGDSAFRRLTLKKPSLVCGSRRPPRNHHDDDEMEMDDSDSQAYGGGGGGGGGGNSPHRRLSTLEVAGGGEEEQQPFSSVSPTAGSSYGGKKHATHRSNTSLPRDEAV